MSESSLVLARYEFPDSVGDVKSCAVGKKILELYGEVQTSFDFGYDESIARALGFFADRAIHYAHSDDKVRGFISHEQVRIVNGVTVHHLVVDAGSRNLSIGAALLHRVEDEAEKAGFGSINLRTQEISRGFYHRMGYQEVKPPRGHMMQLRLPRV